MERAFRPSYEGWKPGEWRSYQWHILLLDLPMRDGNLVFFGPSGSPFELLDLPMRDGNSVDRPANGRYRVRLLDLPMRDGNWSWFWYLSYFRAAFRPSYEGWKLLLLSDLGPGLRSFRPSYEGWKQTYIPSLGRWDTAF